MLTSMVYAQMLIQRWQLIKIINVSAYKITLTYVYRHLSASARIFAPT